MNDFPLIVTTGSRRISIGITFYCCRLSMDIAGENAVIISTLRNACNVRYIYNT